MAASGIRWRKSPNRTTSSCSVTTYSVGRLSAATNRTLPASTAATTHPAAGSMRNVETTDQSPPRRASARITASQRSTRVRKATGGGSIGDAGRSEGATYAAAAAHGKGAVPSSGVTAGRTPMASPPHDAVALEPHAPALDHLDALHRKPGPLEQRQAERARLRVQPPDPARRRPRQHRAEEGPADAAPHPVGAHVERRDVAVRRQPDEPDGAGVVLGHQRLVPE